MERLARMLDEGGYSCVIENRTGVHTFTRRGVADLYDLCTASPDMLAGARIADKVVGKGAAALMAIGGVSEVYARVISSPALRLLEEHGIAVTFGREVPNIINRAGDGVCPVESLCAPLRSLDDMYRAIGTFIARMKNDKNK